MTELDKKLAALAALTGRSPVRIVHYHSYGEDSIDCADITCLSGECPFYDKKTALRSSCTAPRDGSPDFDKATVKTYELAITTHPELFL